MKVIFQLGYVRMELFWNIQIKMVLQKLMILHCYQHISCCKVEMILAQGSLFHVHVTIKFASNIVPIFVRTFYDER
jgi:hypothetical protein